MTLPRQLTRVPRAMAATLAALVLGFAVDMATSAWAQQSTPLAQQELDWAKAALERNGSLEVVSIDPSTGWITVRVKSTGELRKVFAGSVVATVPSAGPAATPPTSPAAAASATPAAPAETATQAAPVPAAPKGERVLLSGPGYSIAAAGPGVAASATEPATAAGGASIAGGIPLERLHEPIICQGSRLLHIDSRNLEFDGDAFNAENGCELLITNSRIVASGVGIEARGASVHIENSSIEGKVGSIDASSGAQVYASSSTFRGLIRRGDTAAFHDMGGNVGD